MNSAAAIAAPVTAADRFGIGPGRHRRHAVDMSIAATAESDTPVGRHPVIFGVCGERVTLARKWGAYGDQNGMLAERRCEQCSWIVALHQGTTEREIVRYSPDELQRKLIANSGHNPDLLTALLCAVLANHRDELNYERPEPGVVSELLAHLCRHRPVVIVCGECWDSSPQVHGPDISVCPERDGGMHGLHVPGRSMGGGVRRQRRRRRMLRALAVLGSVFRRRSLPHRYDHESIPGSESP